VGHGVTALLPQLRERAAATAELVDPAWKDRGRARTAALERAFDEATARRPD